MAKPLNVVMCLSHMAAVEVGKRQFLRVSDWYTWMVGNIPLQTYLDDQLKIFHDSGSMSAQ